MWLAERKVWELPMTVCCLPMFPSMPWAGAQLALESSQDTAKLGLTGHCR